MAWSGGKDSAYALYQLMKSELYEPRFLLSTINGNNHRLSMHGVREELIEAQSESMGIGLRKVYVYEGTNEEYENSMQKELLKVKADGVGTIAFGDIFLEDLRAYREEQMRKIGMGCLFPIWKRDTHQLVRDFIREGFKTLTCCVNEAYLDQSRCGILMDEKFIRDLPAGVDPCGENGEFHSFCFEGPIFKKKLSIITGEKVFRKPELNSNGFWFCDLLKK